MISKEDVKYVVNLAKLHLNEEEIEMYRKQLGDILKYVEKLKELDVSQVEATAHVLPLRNILRVDEVAPSLEGKEALRNAPSQEKGCFSVPKVME